MKKILLPVLALCLTATAMAAPQTFNKISQLNLEVKKILKPFQNIDTEARLRFLDIKTDQDRALSLKLNGLYRKFGNNNRLTLRIEDLSYNYGNGSGPLTIAKGSFGLNLTKIIPQEDLNSIVPGAEEMVKEFAKSFTEQYGDSVLVDARVLEKRQDAQGNFTFLSAELGVKFDLSKLPENIRRDEIPVLEGTVNLSVDFRKGLGFEAKIVSNPEYSAFQKDQQGLKEILDALLARDTSQLKQIEDIFRGLDDMAKGLVNKQE